LRILDSFTDFLYETLGSSTHKRPMQAKRACGISGGKLLKRCWSVVRRKSDVKMKKVELILLRCPEEKSIQNSGGELVWKR
jgi:hypothetical protein